MGFMIPNILNCCIEYIVLLLLFYCLNEESVKKIKNLVVLIGAILHSIIATVIDSFLFSVLPFNWLLVFLCFLLGFQKSNLKNILWDTLISYALMIFLQVIISSILPVIILGSHIGNFIGNGCVLVIAILFYVISSKLHFKEFYSQNKQQVRIFFLILCVPEMITAQFFASVLTSTNKFVVLLVLLLQLLYATALLLAFSVINRKNERRQYADIIRHMDTLNNVLDSFKQDTHDFNKHIRYLQNIVETRTMEGKIPELREDVSAYCRDLLAYSHEKELLLHLDNPTFRALLYGRRSQAEQKKIQFYIDATKVLPDFPIKTYQLVEIFDNLMDNAFECVETMADNRWIRVVLHCEQMGDGHCLNVLCIQNPYETLDFEALVNQNGYSSKGGHHQGIGLRKVEILVSTTGGQLILGNENQTFSVKIQYIT